MICAYTTKVKNCPRTYKASKKLKQRFAARGRFMYDYIAHMHLRALLLWHLTSFSPRGEVKGWDNPTVNKTRRTGEAERIIRNSKDSSVVTDDAG